MNPYLLLLLLLAVAAAIITIEHFDFSKLKKFRSELKFGEPVTVDNGMERFNATLIILGKKDCRVMDSDMNMSIQPYEFIYPVEEDEAVNV